MITLLRTSLITAALVLILHLGVTQAQEAVPEKALPASDQLTPETTPTEQPAPAVDETTAAPVAKEKPKTEKGIQEMTEEEKAAAGLEKLSPAELEYLDEWMRTQKRSAEKKAAEKATEQVKKETQKTEGELAAKAFMKSRDYALVSRVNGTMTQLTGRTIVTLEDGTRWKQANKGDRYLPKVTDHPAAAVFYTQFGYKMRIEGMPDFYVDQVRD